MNLRAGCRWHLIRGVFVVGLASNAQATPLDNVADWAQNFTELALKTDTSGMVEAIESAADPRFNKSVLPTLMESVTKIVPRKSASYAEQFANKELGTFLKRINIAVVYDNQYLCYSLVFMRGSVGWQITNISIYGDVNKILRLDWPS